MHMLSLFDVSSITVLNLGLLFHVALLYFLLRYNISCNVSLILLDVCKFWYSELYNYGGAHSVQLISITVFFNDELVFTRRFLYAALTASWRDIRNIPFNMSILTGFRRLACGRGGFLHEYLASWEIRLNSLQSFYCMK